MELHFLRSAEQQAIGVCIDGITVHFSDLPGKDRGIMIAIVKAVIARLEHRLHHKSSST